MTRRALLSVWDKTGLADFGRGLVARGFELVASGGSARALVDAGLPVTEVDEVTGHPEILGGRVKTLHPAIHGGILARRTDAHLAELQAHGIAPFDVVVCNLYPFEATVAKPGVTMAEAIEQIDIGGVALLRAAAKNHESVAVISDPSRYADFLHALDDGGPDDALRQALALDAFRHTAAYDAAISGWLARQVDGDAALPEVITLRAKRTRVLRYGENPHQQAALYQFAGATPAFERIGGEKDLSFNNLVDFEAAWAMPQPFSRPAVAIIKHTNPSGLAVADDLLTAFDRALACDPVSAFGGILATNRTVDEALVERLGKLFLEVIAAPDFTPGALELLARKKKSCRVLRVAAGAASPLRIRDAFGGLLVQTPDDAAATPDAWQVLTERAPTEAELADLRFAWTACRFVKSNAIVLAKGEATVGVGAGQMNRVDSVRIATWRAGDRAKGAVLASDAFFPFPDGVEAAADAGVTAVVQPGGSIRDDAVVEAANRLGLAMVATGTRHFLH